MDSPDNKVNCSVCGEDFSFGGDEVHTMGFELDEETDVAHMVVTCFNPDTPPTLWQRFLHLFGF